MKDNDYLILIGKNISRIRKEQLITIKELGFRCDIEKSNLIPIEKGRINVTIKTLVKICNALDIELKDLLKS
jgi:transcriptional regulator with XRE-family HTH domain